jgi:type IV pilus assembly protein PilN
VIRINLLPVKAARKREAGQRQLLMTVLGLLALCVALAVFHLTQAGSLGDIRRENDALQAEIDQLKTEVGDIDQRRAQKNELAAQDRVIAQLRAGQTGPLWVMRELSQLLSIGGQPTIDAKAYEEIVRRDPNAAYNPTWDPRRLMLGAYGESQGSVKIDAEATDNADVAEFLKRLALSKYFQDVRLVRSEMVSATAGGFKHAKFTVNCRVVYR